MKNLLFAILLLPLFATASSHDSVASSRSLLWKISGNGLSKPSYLFGTIHIICPDDFLWTDSMKAALRKASKVCFEMDLDDPELLKSAMAAISSGSSKNGGSLQMSKSAEARLRKFVIDSFGIDIRSLPSSSPLVLQSLFLTKLLDCPVPASYESRIMTEATAGGKEIIGLESVEEQMNTLTSVLNDSSGAEMLSFVDSFAAAKRLYSSMVKTYKSQDLPAIYNLMIQTADLKGRTGILLDDRNRRWVPRMRPEMMKGPVFYAVGAGHLWGDAGLIALLRRAGYSLSPVR